MLALLVRQHKPAGFLRMPVAHGYGLDTRTGHELCVAVRKFSHEALIKTCGHRNEPRKLRPGCRRQKAKRKVTLGVLHRQDTNGFRAIKDPMIIWNQPAREPGDPKSVKQINLAFLPSVLYRADEVIKDAPKFFASWFSVFSPTPQSSSIYVSFFSWSSGACSSRVGHVSLGCTFPRPGGVRGSSSRAGSVRSLRSRTGLASKVVGLRTRPASSSTTSFPSSTHPRSRASFSGDSAASCSWSTRPCISWSFDVAPASSYLPLLNTVESAGLLAPNLRLPLC